MAFLNIKTDYLRRLQLWVGLSAYYAACPGEDRSTTSRLIFSQCALDGHTSFKILENFSSSW